MKGVKITRQAMTTYDDGMAAVNLTEINTNVINT